MMKHTFAFLLALSMLAGSSAMAQTSREEQQRRDINPDLKPLDQPPRSDKDTGSNEESSSKDRDTDIGPPTNDKEHPGSMLGGPEPAEGVTEMKPWNPHQADKDVEVGLYYFKQKNYRAAESRFREALYWQDNHAEANYRLGTALEKLGRPNEAREYYQAYLDILPNGELAKDAKKALDRLKAATQSAKKSQKKPTSQP
jgi:tetratricopeptide (TPR) repeat protein